MAQSLMDIISKGNPDSLYRYSQVGYIWGRLNLEIVPCPRPIFWQIFAEKSEILKKNFFWGGGKIPQEG